MADVPCFQACFEKEKILLAWSLFSLHSAITIPLFYSVERVPIAHCGCLAGGLIHLWVEGFFEVFATVVIAYLCSELGFLKILGFACDLLTTILYLGSGVLHHLYFRYTVFYCSNGSGLSALSGSPALIGFEVLKTLKLSPEVLPLAVTLLLPPVFEFSGCRVFGF